MIELTPLRGKIKIKHGFAFKGEYFSQHGKHIVLTPGNFLESGGFKRDEAKDKFYTSTFPKEYILNSGDLIVAMTEQTDGLLGSCAFVPESDLYLHNQRLGLITSDPNEVEPEFLYYLFQTPLVRKQIRLSSTGSKVKHTSPDRIYDVLARLPKIHEQRKLSAVLGSLDAQIVLNNQINAELEEMAKLIYDYWFVQFDFPDENGKPYKSFGGKMVWCDQLKRKIPAGWEARELCQIANITMGQSPAGTSYNSDAAGMLFFQGSTDFGWLFPTARQYTSEPSRLAKKGDILLSVRAPVGDMNIANADCCIGRGLAALNSRQGFDGYLFYVMKYFKQIFDRRDSQGTTFGSITKDDLHSLKVAYPSEPVLKDFENLVSPMNQMIFTRSIENRELAKLRDWLLPMLMNGQVTVGDHISHASHNRAMHKQSVQGVATR